MKVSAYLFTLPSKAAASSRGSPELFRKAPGDSSQTWPRDETRILLSQLCEGLFARRGIGPKITFQFPFARATAITGPSLSQITAATVGSANNRQGGGVKGNPGLTVFSLPRDFWRIPVADFASRPWVWEPAGHGCDRGGD